MRRGSVVLGVVPHIAHLGWALVRLREREEAVLDAGVIRTRQGWRARDSEAVRDRDEHRRGRELAEELRLVLMRERVEVVCALRLPSAARKDERIIAARAWGVVDTCVAALGAPLVHVAHEEVSAVLTTSAVAARMSAELEARLAEDVAESQREWALAAVGAVVASLDTEPCRRARLRVA